MIDFIFVRIKNNFFDEIFQYLRAVLLAHTVNVESLHDTEMAMLGNSLSIVVLLNCF